MTSSQIRKQFIDFFVERHGHTFVPSSPVVPHDDPTLLFTNAGMNQFKPIFLGQEKRSYTRAANTQKCIRAGGKHNDLDDVGRSRRHGTFFEMLGNWSFGDYFKRGAIEMAWELITQVFKLDPTRIHVTCFRGDEANGVPRDTEAAQLWKEIAMLPDDHIHFLGDENFWEMGETGPCGPCTEIFIDGTPDKTGGPSVISGDDPRVMEFWNNVFIQYNRNPDRSLTTLPAQHVDTGMGFERICSILQGTDNMYGIDLFDPFFAALTELTGIKYGGTFPKGNAPDPAAEAASPQLRHDIAFRVIADHLRTLTFALTDGAVVSNEGRGYVLRRILRRAARFGRQQLGLREPFIHKLVPVVVDSMGDAFSELKKNPQQVAEIIKDEEASFGRTLDRGISLFDEAILSQLHKTPLLQELQARGCEVKITPDEDGTMLIWVTEPSAKRILSKRRISSVNALWVSEFFSRTPQVDGRIAFTLHDTYGFPIDLTRIMAEERGMTVDVQGYEKLMEEARERARAGGKEGQSKIAELPPDAIAQLQKEGVKPTDDQPKFGREPVRARVMAIWNGSNFDPSADTNEDQEVAVIFDRTNFYAEMGGQVGDSGVVGSPTTQFDVETTRAVGQYILHIGRVRSGVLKVGDEVTLTVAPQRTFTEKNHTSTHLANWALREVLGEGVQQKGSLVDPEKLRFDFSHGKSMTDEELSRVESLVNRCIEQKLTVYAETAPQEQALKINGLRAVFGEKYPPMVRVVSIGVPVSDLLKDPTNDKWRQYSIEFCGGTHLSRTSDATHFVITSEESVSKGIRRIVALTGDLARSASAAGTALANLVDTARKATDAQLSEPIAAVQKSLSSGTPIPLLAKRRAQAAVAELQDRQRKAEKAAKAASGATNFDVASVASDLLGKAEEIPSGGKIVVGEVPGASDDQLRATMDSLKKRAQSLGVLLGSTDGQKVTFVAAVSDDLIARGLKAGDWVREAAKVTGGGGGGRPQMAQAGGKDPAKLQDALRAASRVALEALSK